MNVDAALNEGESDTEHVAYVVMIEPEKDGNKKSKEIVLASMQRIREMSFLRLVAMQMPISLPISLPIILHLN